MPSRKRARTVPTSCVDLDLDAVRRELIRTGGNMSLAVRSLGLHAHGLHLPVALRQCARCEHFGTDKLAASAVESLQSRAACLPANYGMITVDKTLEAAFENTVKLEPLARQ